MSTPRLAPGTASTLSQMDAAALSKILWDAKYKQDSVRPTVFTDKQVQTDFVINDAEVTILKPGLILDVSNIGKKGQGQSVRCALRTPLAGAPREGTGEDMISNEDESKLLYTELYYNEIKKAVKYNTYGYDYNATEYLGWNEGYSNQVGTYWGELTDHRFQTALLLGVSNELTKAPFDGTIATLTQQFNSNWAIPGLDPSDYPVYDPTAVTTTAGALDTNGYYSARTYGGVGSDFVEAIVDAMIAGSGTGADPEATLTISNILEIIHYVEDQMVVEPILLDGIWSYIWKMPSAVIRWLLNPSKTGSLGEYWMSVKNYVEEKRLTLPGEIGRLCENFVIVKDPRCPTLTVGGSNGSWTLKPGFIYPGNWDKRNNAAWSAESGAQNYVFDVTAIMGANALARYTRDELRMGLIETSEYGKREGRGSYCGDGIQIPRYDIGTKTATSGIYRGSLIVPVSRAPIL